MSSAPPRRLGRRPLVESEQLSSAVHVRLPAGTFDRAYRRARLDRVTMPDLLRRALDRLLLDDDDTDDR
jgi:hypothetical protein